MKQLLLLISLLTVTVTPARAAFVYNSGPLNTTIPDGNPGGAFSTIKVVGMLDNIADINVSLNLSGGANGDLYVYLTHGSGFTVLLNRVGKTSTDPFGYDDAGLNIKLNDQATQLTDIHNYQNVVGFSISGGVEWRPDGRNVDPQNVLASDAQSTALSAFNGLNPNGDWTLFVSDMSGGNGGGTLVSWGLEITPVPEPITIALGTFGGIALLVGVRRKFFGRV